MTSMIDVFSAVIHKLEAENIDYMIVGSIASILYGEPRLTKDMDLVIDLPPAQLRSLERAFSDPQFYCPPFEVISDELVRRGQFNLVHPDSGLKVDLVFRKNTAHSQMEFSRRKKLELWPGLEAWVASPEDVILKKLDFYREGGSTKHLADIRGILAQTLIDQDYLDKWVNTLGLVAEWGETR